LQPPQEIRKIPRELRAIHLKVTEAKMADRHREGRAQI